MGELLLIIVRSGSWSLIALAMVRCKNVGGSPSDDERRSRRFTGHDKAKGLKKQLAMKKHTRAERGGRGGTLTIGERLTPVQ